MIRNRIVCVRWPTDDVVVYPLTQWNSRAYTHSRLEHALCCLSVWNLISIRNERLFLGFAVQPIVGTLYSRPAWPYQRFDIKCLYRKRGVTWLGYLPALARKKQVSYCLFYSNKFLSWRHCVSTTTKVFDDSWSLKDLSLLGSLRYSSGSTSVRHTPGPIQIISLKFLKFSATKESGKALISEQTTDSNPSFLFLTNVWLEDDTLMMQVPPKSICRILHIFLKVPCFSLAVSSLDPKLVQSIV